DATGPRAEAHEPADLTGAGASKTFPSRPPGNSGSLLERVVVRARADRRERNRANAMSRRERARRDVAAPQQLGVTPPPAAPHGTHRVDHVLGPEAVASREARLTGGATAQRPALLEQRWAGRAMDRTVHAAAAQECRIGRVND